MATKAQRELANQNRLKAMSHPLRARILKRLIEMGTLSPAEVGREMDISSSLASHHMKRLVTLDCAELVKEESVKGRAVAHFYRPTVRHLIDTDEWVNLPLEVKETLLPEFFQPMVDDLTAAADLLYAEENWHITRTPQVVDQEGLLEGMEVMERARLEMLEVEKRSSERLATSGEPPLPVSTSFVYFRTPSPR